MKRPCTGAQVPWMAPRAAQQSFTELTMIRTPTRS